MRQWINLVEAYRDAAPELIDALSAWIDGYEKGHAWTGEGNDLERKIIALSEPHPVVENGWLYRGTGISDEDAKALARGETVTLQPHRRLLVSWTKSRRVASAFLDDALEDNMSAALIRMSASRLDLVIDVEALGIDGDFLGESEVIAHNIPLTVSPSDVLQLWIYDEDNENVTKVH